MRKEKLNKGQKKRENQHHPKIKYPTMMEEYDNILYVEEGEKSIDTEKKM